MKNIGTTGTGKTSALLKWPWDIGTAGPCKIITLSTSKSVGQWDGQKSKLLKLMLGRVTLGPIKAMAQRSAQLKPFIIKEIYTLGQLTQPPPYRRYVGKYIYYTLSQMYYKGFLPVPVAQPSQFKI